MGAESGKRPIEPATTTAAEAAVHAPQAEALEGAGPSKHAAETSDDDAARAADAEAPVAEAAEEEEEPPSEHAGAAG
jgi:hypothetical protein